MTDIIKILHLIGAVSIVGGLVVTGLIIGPVIALVYNLDTASKVVAVIYFGLAVFSSIYGLAVAIHSLVNE